MLIAARNTTTAASMVHRLFKAKYGKSRIGVSLIVIASAIRIAAARSLRRCAK